jgi:hypothetical protein
MIRTTGDIIRAAFLTAGVQGIGQPTSATDASTGFDLLREVLAGWRQDPGLAWVLKDYSVVSTGAVSYQLPDRPRRLASAFVRLLIPNQPQVGQMDRPQGIMTSRQQYNEIALKHLTTWPAAVWLEQTYPLPSIYVWPIPTADLYEIHVSYQSPLPTYTSLAQPLGLPDEYVEAIRYALAAKIAMDYGADPRPAQIARLRGVLARIRAANMQMADLEIDGSLLPGGPGSGGISGSVAPFQSVFVLNTSVLG